MKLKEGFLTTLCTIIVLSFCGCSTSSGPEDVESSGLRGAYLGETLPGTVPQLFAPFFFTDALELHSPPVFSPDGNEVFYSPMEGNPSELVYMKMINGEWTAPSGAPFNSPYASVDPSFNPQGNKLFFLSWDAGSGKENIWYVEKDGDQWGEPQMLGNEINRLDVHWQVSIAANGNLYFAGGQAGTNQNGIYCSQFINGAYQNAELMSNAINTEYYEGTPFIAPDESYLIFSRFGGNDPYTDLFISFHNPDGTWTDAVNMGSAINTSGHELYPYLTSDGQYLIFLSTRSGLSKPYWMSADFIESLY